MIRYDYSKQILVLGHGNGSIDRSLRGVHQNCQVTATPPGYVPCPDAQGKRNKPPGQPCA